MDKQRLKRLEKQNESRLVRRIRQPELRDLFGVSDMTIWRWWAQAGILPKPTVIRGRNYWPEDVIERLLEKGENEDEAA